MLLNSISGSLNFLLTRKNDDFIEFKGHHIYRKQVPLLHKKVLTLWYERDGLVGVKKHVGINQLEGKKNKYT